MKTLWAIFCILLQTCEHFLSTRQEVKTGDAEAKIGEMQFKEEGGEDVCKWKDKECLNVPIM